MACKVPNLKKQVKMLSPNRKRLIQNGLLLVLVAGLIFFVTTKNNDDNEAVYSTLYDKSIGDDAKEIIIHAEGRQDVVLVNNDGLWKVTKPVVFIADKKKVQHLFTLLSENADSHYDIKGKKLADYGLDKDNLSVSFNGVKFIFGKLNNITQKRFIRRDNQMYLIEETVSGLLLMGADAFKPQALPELKPVEK